MSPLPGLPVDAELPRLVAALAAHPAAVLVAPPGAGKTTRVPLALLAGVEGRIVMLEPRRIAARAAARRLARTLGERVGETVGLRVRGETRVSTATRIEVVTEGVLVRALLDDPELRGVGCVVFDEFHERSLDADLGLALTLHAREILRLDLRVLVMSATLDGARVARLLGPDASVIESTGRAFPVDVRHGRAPASRRPRDVADAVAGAVLEVLGTDGGSILAFLPGTGEIRATAERLGGRVPADVAVAPLYGTLSAEAQDAAIEPAPHGRRKVVLATSIAETSLTIDGVRVVVDAGLARRPRHDAGSGMSRLETVRVSRAEADQRAGRAGRTAPGVALRLWSLPEDTALEPFARPEITQADLAAARARPRRVGRHAGRTALARPAAPTPPSTPRAPCSPTSARSTPRAHSPPTAAPSPTCRCTRALATSPSAPAGPHSPPTSWRSSPSATRSAPTGLRP